jgi:hypothetical protein
MAPRPWARGGVTFATLALPRGETRNRYRQEFLADLHVLPRPDHAAYTLAVLANAWSLRQAAAGHTRTKEITMKKPQTPLGCRLNLRHHWHWEPIENSAERIRRCTRCGKFGGVTGQGSMDHAWPIGLHPGGRP